MINLTLIEAASSQKNKVCSKIDEEMILPKYLQKQKNDNNTKSQEIIFGIANLKIKVCRVQHFILTELFDDKFILFSLITSYSLKPFNTLLTYENISDTSEILNEMLVSLISKSNNTIQ